MDKGHAQSIDWLQRHCDLLHRKANDVWNELTGAMAPAMSSTEPAERLFTQLLDAEIALCRAIGLKAHLEGEDKSLRFDDASIGGLFERVHTEETALVDQFERWKGKTAPPLAAVDLAPWREAMASYFRASPGEI
ncbi:hypothetical protein J8I26_17090 [Herbaspirillum sp. LeCh32-8]|uniref:hypothetical protein n=1 Tax=Herbaspirillum sp. LeCh32-8 TaxID=2821356 RepID=UPI001AE7E8AD|nr:hypothetical protein [Herbaspirillum sp. LeCh32-8]MBP0599829.1 hypothetical protein [Herbaspirillum sp. LeCh32-8]